ncbi:MAG: chemotaxis response regulator protein-glutamate methylesterase [Planctomycetota bacterium]
MTDRTLKVLIVDDSALYRQTIATALRDIPSIDVVGTAENGQQAIEKIRAIQPDILTLDVEMPVMNGIETLRVINQQGLPARAIMVSTLTQAGAKVTLDALMEGAFDFIEKPTGGLVESRNCLRSALCEKLSAFRQYLDTRDVATDDKLARMPVSLPQRELDQSCNQTSITGRICEAVLIGLSTGGPKALNHVVPRLDAEFPVPVIVVQHMPAAYTKLMADRLNGVSELNVVEAQAGLRIERGNVYLARGGQHLDLVVRNGNVHCGLTMDPPINACRPAVDYTFGRAIDAWGGNLLGVIMTGMGKDGLEACQRLHEQGGTVFAQDAATSAVYGMPKAVADAGIVDRSIPLGRIAPAITRHVHRNPSSS